MTYRELSATDAAWLAGFIDADGSIGLGGRQGSRYWLRPMVQVGQASKAVLEHIVDLVGEGSIGKNSKRTFYNLRYGPTVFRWLLPQLIPYLVVKRKQAELLLEYADKCKYHPGAQQGDRLGELGQALTGEQIEERLAFKAQFHDLNMKPKTRRDQANGASSQLS